MKMAKPNQFSKLLTNYQSFVKANPSLMSELETGLRWMSYFTTNRFAHSNVVAELMCTASSLLNLTNDIVLRRVHALPVSSSQTVTSLKTLLQVIDYCQVFAEITARTLSGEPMRWMVITIIQFVKTVIRLALLFGCSEGIQRGQPVPQLNRKIDLDYADKLKTERHKKRAQATFILKSGRQMQALESTPPLSKRRWCETQTEDPMARMEQKFSFVPTSLKNSQILGELLNIMRPLAHLVAIRQFGLKSWAPWAVAASMDVTSIQFLRGENLKHPEKMELSRRTMLILLYLMRSPFYDDYTKTRLLSTLRTMSDSLPLIRLLLNPLIEYLPEWQRTYFYTWS